MPLNVNPEAEFESPFEQQVAEALHAKGYEVHPQVGCSDYRIDLAVVDPDSPGAYLMGIECDGANYHRARTARDRDRLREMVLRGLGWTLHRVWSTDWWEDPAKEIEKILAAIEKARVEKLRQQKPVEQSLRLVASAPSLSPAATSTMTKPSPSSPNPRQYSSVYNPYVVRKQVGDPDSFYMPNAGKQIMRLIEEVVNVEGPISMELAAKRILPAWGLLRFTTRAEKQVAGIIRHAQVTIIHHGKRTFLWPVNLDPNKYDDFRVPGRSDDSRRGAEDLPPEEVSNAALAVMKNQISIPQTDLIRETALLLGFQRVGQNVERYIDEGISLLLKTKRVKESDEMIILS